MGTVSFAGTESGVVAFYSTITAANEIAGALPVGGEASLAYDTSDHYVLGGVLSGMGKGKSGKPLTVGWADVAGAAGGVAGGVSRR